MTASRPIGSGKVATITSAPHALASFDRLVHVGHEIAGPLGAEGIGDRRLEAEHRNGPDRRLQQLRRRAARRRRHRNDDLLGALTSEGREKARDESVDVLWRHIDVGGVVLRADADLRSGRRRGDPARWRSTPATSNESSRTFITRWLRIMGSLEGMELSR